MDRQEIFADSGADSFDPYILSLAANYERGGWGVGVAYEEHNDWSADVLRRRGSDFSASGGSEDEAWRATGWYTFSFGNGSSLKLAAVYEDLEYNFDGTLESLVPYESLDKDAWAFSFNYNTGPWSFMGHYQDADEIDCNSNVNNAVDCVEDNTDADSWTLGVAYDLSKRTRFWLTYGEIDNEDQAAYDFAISGAGTPLGGEAQAWALRFQHAW
jgi:predicted porin